MSRNLARRWQYAVLAMALGCGRVGVEPLPAAGATDAANDAAPQDGSEAADAADTGTSDPSDAGTPPAAPDCQLTVDGTSVAYRSGEVGRLSGTQVFTLQQAGLTFSPAACSQKQGASIALATVDRAICQRWEAIDVGGGWYALRNALSGGCLNLASSADGANPVVWECVPGDPELWQVVCVGNDAWHLVSKVSKKRLQSDGQPAAGSGVVQLAADPASDRQRWTIESRADAYTAIVPTSESDPGETWRYTTLNPGQNWTQASFDDATWSSGRAGLGDKATPYRFVRTTWTTSDIWMRRTFTLTDLGAALSIRVFHDDDAEVFINGVLAASMTGWSQSYVSAALSPAAKAALSTGTNTLAVHCYTRSAPQYIDVGIGIYRW